MSGPPDCTLGIIHTKDCLLAILSAVNNPDFDCEETLEKITAAANEGLRCVSVMLDAIAEAGDP
jgi:hypothetical protein